MSTTFIQILYKKEGGKNRIVVVFIINNSLSSPYLTSLRPCVNITKEPPEDQKWFCPPCDRKNKASSSRARGRPRGRGRGRGRGRKQLVKMLLHKKQIIWHVQWADNTLKYRIFNELDIPFLLYQMMFIKLIVCISCQPRDFYLGIERKPFHF